MIPATKAVRCSGCLAFVRQDSDGWLFPHTEKNLPGGEICMSRVPLPSSPDEYPTGFDSEPRWVMRGGLPETDRRRF